MEAIWRSMEELHATGVVRRIGISHAHTPQEFQRLLDMATVKPSVVQNPIYAANGWDREIRDMCREHGIVYQAYALNHKDNDYVYQDTRVRAIAARLDRTPQQVIVAFIKQLGLLPLVGPQDPIKMAQAVTAASHMRLTEAEMNMIENIASTNGPFKGNPPADTVAVTVTNRLDWAVNIAWQHPDHTHLRSTQGMHALPDTVQAGDSFTINTRHRHNFYIWDASEGVVAPLYDEDTANRKWVKRFRVDGHLASNDIVVDESFKVVVSNIGAEDGAELFYVTTPEEDAATGDVPVLSSQGEVPAPGAEFTVTTFDGHVFEVHDAAGGVRRLQARRRDGDPQLLAVHATQPSEHVEL